VTHREFIHRPRGLGASAAAQVTPGRARPPAPCPRAAEEPPRDRGRPSQPTADVKSGAELPLRDVGLDRAV